MTDPYPSIVTVDEADAVIRTREERIAKLAYRMWELEGRPHGKDLIHWDIATSLVDSYTIIDNLAPTMHMSDAGARMIRDTFSATNQFARAQRIFIAMMVAHGQE